MFLAVNYRLLNFLFSYVLESLLVDAEKIGDTYALCLGITTFEVVPLLFSSYLPSEMDSLNCFPPTAWTLLDFQYQLPNGVTATLAFSLSLFTGRYDEALELSSTP